MKYSNLPSTATWGTIRIRSVVSLGITAMDKVPFLLAVITEIEQIFLSEKWFVTHPPATGGYPPLGTALPGLLLNISACGPGPVL